MGHGYRSCDDDEMGFRVAAAGAFVPGIAAFGVVAAVIVDVRVVAAGVVDVLLVAVAPVPVGTALTSLEEAIPPLGDGAAATERPTAGLVTLLD